MRKVLLAVLWVLAACVPMLAQGTYTQIDVPGARYTAAYGINAAGDVVGCYQDSSGKDHGFILSAGVYTTLDYPDKLHTFLYAMNDAGQVVGEFENTALPAGFSYDPQTQTFTNLVFAKDSIVMPTGVDNAGTVVGVVYAPHQIHPDFGFEFTEGVYRTVRPRGFGYSYVNGINNLGEAVGGGSKDQQHVINFLFAGSEFQTLKINLPKAVPHAINSAGAIVGEYSPSGTVMKGFLCQNSGLQILGFPGSTQTGATGINDVGDVVGFFVDAAGSVHGYMWTPPTYAAKE